MDTVVVPKGSGSVEVGVARVSYSAAAEGEKVVGFSTEAPALHAETAREHKRRVDYNYKEWFFFILVSAVGPVRCPQLAAPRFRTCSLLSPHCRWPTSLRKSVRLCRRYGRLDFRCGTTSKRRCRKVGCDARLLAKQMESRCYCNSGLRLRGTSLDAVR